MRFSGGEHPGLQTGEFLHPARVRRVERLVDHPGAPGGIDRELGVGGVPGYHLDIVRYAGRAGPVNHPHGFAAAEQGLEGGQADRTGAEDDVLRSSGHAVSFAVAVAGLAATVGLLTVGLLTVALGVARAGSSCCRSTPERAEKVTAPLAPKMVNCSSTGIPARVVTIQ